MKLEPGRYAIEVSRPSSSGLLELGREVSQDELLTKWIAMVKPAVAIRKVVAFAKSVLYELEVRTPVELPDALPVAELLKPGRELEDFQPTSAADYVRDTSEATGPTMAGALETVAKAAVVVGLALLVAQVLKSTSAPNPQKG